MKKIFIWTILLSLFCCRETKSQAKSEKISLEKIEGMFSRMKSEGVNTKTPMLWGYFFVAPKQRNFEQIKNELNSQNFEFIKIFQSDNKDYWLHFERKEIHDAQSLFELNKELYKVAEKYKVTYDGFDVGNVDPSKAIERDTYVVPEDFKVADLVKDNYPYLLIGNTGFDRFPHKEEFKYFLKVTTPFQTKDESLLPTDIELEELDEFGQFIELNLTKNSIKNYLVFRDTYKGIRTISLVTDNGNGATELLRVIKNSNTTRKFEFQITEDSKWSLYEDIKSKFPEE